MLIQVAEPPRYALVIADLTSGRRFLSDDVAALEFIGVLLGRRIDAIRMTHERYERELREQHVAKLATEAELRALRAQLNPAFPVQRVDDDRATRPGGADASVRDHHASDSSAAWRIAL